jgi:hypothetical protein
MCNLVDVYRRHSSILKIEAASSSETSVNLYYIKWRHVQEDRVPAFHFWKNFVIKSLLDYRKPEIERCAKKKNDSNVQNIKTQASKKLFMPETN